MAEVAKVRTKSDAQSVANELARAWHARFGEQLPGSVAALMLALSDLEVATWNSMFNFNPGNLVATNESGPFYRAVDTGNPRRFKAFPSLAAGVAEFVAQLTRDSRPEWHAGLLTGNPDTFVRALGGQFGGEHYFEGPPGLPRAQQIEAYLRAYMARYPRYAHLAEQTPRPRQPGTPSTPSTPARRKPSDDSSGAGVAVALLLTVGAGAAILLAKRMVG